MPTEPLNRLPSGTHHSYETAKALDTRPSGSISKIELTEDSYIAEPSKSKEQSVPAFLIKEEKNSKFNGKMFWLLPTAALGILTVSSIGGIVWLSNSGSVESDKPPTNVEISTPTPAPTITPTIKSGVSPSVQPTPAPTQNKPVIADNPKPKPTVTPKRTPAIIRTERAPPKPKKAPNMSDDCIYNGKCGW